MPFDDLKPPRRGLGWLAVVILGLVLGLIGIALTIGGAWLVALRGSPYYLLAGLGLIAAGIFIARRRVLGAWIYLAVFIATLVWAVWEVGLQGWPLVPRIVAPAVLMLLVIAAMPVLSPGRIGRRMSLGGLAAFALLLGACPASGRGRGRRPGNPWQRARLEVA